MRLASLSVPVLLGLSVPVVAWGPEGHQIVATIAQIHLFPSTLSTICSLLNPSSSSPTISCDLAPLATWADEIKVNSTWNWAAPLHYVGAWDDHPGDTCVFPGPGGWNGNKNVNVLGGVRNVSGILEEWVERGSGRGRAQEALRFLVHFLGDMHQPLHLTGLNRGGNGVKVTFDGIPTNLHSVWDDSLINQTIHSLPPNYTNPLPYPRIERVLHGASYDGYVRRLFWEGLFGGRWEEEEVDAWFECPDVPMNPTPHVSPSLPQMFGSWTELARKFTQTVLGYTSSQEGGVGMDPTDDTIICPYAWAIPTHDLLCDFAWPKALTSSPSPSRLSNSLRTSDPLPELNIPSYTGKIREEWVVERLLVMGGLRLAMVLNYLFEGEEVGVRFVRG
ncbi:hypothetical protein JAAARDRAFT_162321 [Jaapia argillacea MUCL 33604]|uniref:Phospholipase C/P1 nuclease n=1 Tax=Jaapia argillacea MUCL 33604 TaxID=933084 RepID=A0A067PDD3_9AGAM|nr:hypothetical protein JAAARDRAFT_162321 [Jaapia argillacea MUCL 33604]